eukprot:9479318-Pyramimonas_sp.AAC.1
MGGGDSRGVENFEDHAGRAFIGLFRVPEGILVVKVCAFARRAEARPCLALLSLARPWKAAKSGQALPFAAQPWSASRNPLCRTLLSLAQPWQAWLSPASPGNTLDPAGLR